MLVILGSLVDVTGHCEEHWPDPGMHFVSLSMFRILECRLAVPQEIVRMYSCFDKPWGTHVKRIKTEAGLQVPL